VEVERPARARMEASIFDQRPQLRRRAWGTALERRKVARMASCEKAKSAAGARWPRV
jgi:hypothetical protein